MHAIPKQRRRANFKSIEMELRYYNQLKQQVEERRQDIIDSTEFAEVPCDTGPGNIVLSKVLQLTSSAVIMETERRLRAIEYALDVTRQADPDRLRMVELKYFDNRLTDAGIVDKLHISKRTFYRWKQEFISLIGERLGLEV